MADPPVLRRLFLLLCEMEEQVEPAEIGILVDDGLRLLVLERIQFMNRIDQGAQQLEFFDAKRNVRLRDMPGNISLMHL